MGEHSFGRLIKQRRDDLGLSQARLADLVGRSATTVRNWERDKTTPSERSDVVALAAVLGIDEAEALNHAGFEANREAEHRTIEQAYSSLGPAAAEDDASGPQPQAETLASPVTESADGSDEVADAAEDQASPGNDEGDSAPVESDPEVSGHTGHIEEAEDAAAEVGGPASDPVSDDDLVTVGAMVGPEPDMGRAERRRRLRRAAPPTVLEAAPVGEPSYMEDPEERQQYRFRALATLAAIAFLIIVLGWAMGRATDALSGMWNDFFSLLDF